MEQVLSDTERLSSLQQSLIVIQKLKSRLYAIEKAKTEPIAIIGMGCRFPGADDPQAFWNLLRDGVDAVREVPPDRWDVDAYYDPDHLDAPGKMYTRFGGFLEHVDQFDPQFFGITPLEAVSMDPQQRLVLEVSWEALENAGQSQDRLAGSQTGVFVGVTADDYARLLSRSIEASDIDAYFSIGTAFSAIAGRLSYLLGLHGPSMIIDTACSSSLVAVHLACQSLRAGECRQALAGGVNLILAPEVMIALSRARMLSPDGLCRTFDAAANGYIRGEGCGIVVLKRFSDAVANRDNILALILGSAVNHDGPSSGFTVPNGLAQQEVIRRALRNARVEPVHVDYVESHGTGTSLGDPVEVDAMGTVFRINGSHDYPLVIGSVKTNIGHLEAAAGVASLIKVVLALHHREIPPHLHFKKPNPHIPWGELPVMVPTERMPWPSWKGKRIAGVSSFGLSGTNAHVVAEEAPVTEPVQADMERPLHLLTLSAKTEGALKELSARYEKHFFANPSLVLGDVCFTANTGRSHFEHRLAMVAKSTEQVCEDLSTFASGKESCDVVRGQINSGKRPKIAFLFTGQGSQYVGMGRELYETQPTFRKALKRCNDILRPYLETPLLDVLYPEAGKSSPLLEETAYAHPALFAVEYALAELWQSWGITPSAVMGHSVGEYVAACVAGVFSLEDGLRLIVEHARLMEALLQKGGQVSLMAGEARVVRAIQPHAKDVSLTGLNGPENIVISGKSSAVLMEPMLEAFDRVAREVSYASPRLALISNVTGKRASEEIATAGYWVRHVRQPVCFVESMEALYQRRYEVFVEIGPKPILLGMGRQCLPAGAGVWLPSLREGQSDWEQLLQSLGELYVHGVPVDWSGFDRDYPRRRVALPTYPFQRQRYWIELQHQRAVAPPGETAQSVSSLPSKKSDIAEWFYISSWKRAIVSARQAEGIRDRSCWLVFTDECGLGAHLVKELKRQGQDVITVELGSAFTNLGQQMYALNPGERNDYQALLIDLRTQGKSPKMIVHLWSVTPKNHATSGLERVEQTQRVGFYSLLHLAQALGKQNVTNAVQIAVVSNNMQEVTGGDALYPEKATVLGPCRVIPQEYPNIRCRSIDVEFLPPSGASKQKLIDQLFRELTMKSPDTEIAYRGHYRWVQTFEPMRLDGAFKETVQLKKGGVYLITGGLGKIGLTLAEYLAKTVQAKLILISRSAFPAREEWGHRLAMYDEQDSIKRKIQKVEEMEKLGAEILVISADVADKHHMHDVIAEVEKRFSKIHGVIHAAGMVGEGAFRAIQATTRTDCEQHFRPKLYGLLVLEEVLRGRELDFCLLLSSLSSVLGGMGFVAYSASNLFMDAFVHHHNRPSSSKWISVNWDGWKFGEEMRNTPFGTNLVELAITPQEGTEVFRRIISWGGADQVVVSTGDLSSRIAKWVKFESIREKKTSRGEKSSFLHPRPNLNNAYVAPQNELEETIAGIWGELLGIEKVGIYDNFFELGGHSLLGTQLISQVRKVFKMELPLDNFFESLTVASLAETLVKYETMPGQVETIARLYKKVDQMSADEIHTFLLDKKKAREKTVYG